MRIEKSWVRLLLFVPLLLILSAQPAFAQDDILDEIEAELKKEEEQNKAQEKADKNKEKYEKLYEVTKRRGDALVRAKKFDEAIDAFTEAKGYDPSDPYPDSQIALAKQEKKRAEEDAKEVEIKEKYNIAIVKADAYFKGQKYKEAIGAYQEASGIKSDEVYPTDQISESKKLMAKKEEDEKKIAASAQIEKEYSAAMSKGDAAMKSKDYDAAITAYEGAIMIKPSDSEPKSRKTTAEKLKADEVKKLEQEATKKKYDDLILSADDLLKSSEFDQAKAKYEEASKVMPHEPYPKTKMKECDDSKLAAAQASERAAYDELIKKADALVKAESFDQAIIKYQEAAQVMPHENHPKDMIIQVENLKKQKEDTEVLANFEKVLKEGEELIAAEKFNEGIVKLGEAHKVMPHETKTKEIIAQAQKLKAAQANKNKSDAYEAKLKEGEELLHAEKFDEAIVSFNSAKKMMPNDHKAQTLIDQANKLKEGKKQAATQYQFDEKINDGEEFLKDNRFDEAIAAFEEAQSILPNDNKPATLITQTNNIRKTKENEIAKAEYGELISSGDKQLEEGKFGEARESYKGALKVYVEGKGTIDARLAKVDSAEKEKQNADKEIVDKQAKQDQFDKLIGETDALISSKDYSGAKQKIAGALLLYPNDANAKSKKAEINSLMAQAEKEKQEKLSADASAKEEAKKEQQVAGFLSEAETKKTNGNLQAAKSLITSALIVLPQNVDAKTALSDIENAIKDNDKKLAADLAAKKEAEKAAADKKEKIEDLLSEGNSLLANGSFTESISKYDEVLELDASNVNALSKKGEAQKAKENKEQENMAAEEKEKAAQAKKEKIESLIAEAESAEASENYNGAIAKWNEILSVDASNSTAASNVTRLKNKKLEINAALVAAEKADALKKEEEEKRLAAMDAEKAEAEKQSKIATLNKKAKSAENSNDFDGAINKWNEVLAIESSNTDASSGITRVEEKKKEAIAALTAADAAKKKKLDAKARKQAEQEKAAKIEMLSADAQKEESSDNLDLAISKWEEVIALDASSTNAISNVERLEAKKIKNEADKLKAEEAKRKKEEKDAKAKSEQEKRNRIASYLEIGDNILAEKQYQKAIENYKKAENLDPTNLQIKSKLARANELKEDEEEMIAQMEAAEKRQEINILLSDAKLLAIKRQYLDAKEKYDDILSKESGNQRAKDGLASIQINLDQISKQEAEEEARNKARAEVLQKVEVILDDGSDLFAGGQYKEAIEKYKEGLLLDPLNNELKSSIRNSLQALDRHEQYRIAKLHNLPRPKQEGFKTEALGTGERKDKTKFQNELGKAYPEGVTEEKNQGKRKDITKRVVVKEGVGSEFFKIHHDWGGIYYFLDGESIDPYKWQYGTRSPDQINNP
mgnify:FL=1